MVSYNQNIRFTIVRTFSVYQILNSYIKKKRKILVDQFSI